MQWKTHHSKNDKEHKHELKASSKFRQYDDAFSQLYHFVDEYVDKIHDRRHRYPQKKSTYGTHRPNQFEHARLFCLRDIQHVVETEEKTRNTSDLCLNR